MPPSEPPPTSGVRSRSDGYLRGNIYRAVGCLAALRKTEPRRVYSEGFAAVLSILSASDPDASSFRDLRAITERLGYGGGNDGATAAVIELGWLPWFFDWLLRETRRHGYELPPEDFAAERIEPVPLRVLLQANPETLKKAAESFHPRYR